MENKYAPHGDYLLVEEASKEDISSGGIIIAAGIKGNLRGTVVAAGPGLYSANGTLIPMRISEGASVIFEPHSGKEIEVNGGKFKLIREGEILMASDENSIAQKEQLNG